MNPNLLFDLKTGSIVRPRFRFAPPSAHEINFKTTAFVECVSLIAGKQPAWDRKPHDQTTKQQTGKFSGA